MIWTDRITELPNVCHGKACIKGTRVLVSVILADIDAGEPHESIIRGYHVTSEDIQVAIAYRTEMAKRAPKPTEVR